jgi:hypothetical protein
MDGSGGAQAWNQLQNKPFNTVGDGLFVTSDDILKARVASYSSFSSAAGNEKKEISFYTAGGTYYTERLEYHTTRFSVTLGTSETTVRIPASGTDPEITADSTIDVYATDSTLAYKSVTAYAGYVNVVYPAQSSSKTVDIKIYVR